MTYTSRRSIPTGNTFPGITLFRMTRSELGDTLNHLMLLQLAVDFFMAIRVVVMKFRSTGESFFNTEITLLRVLRNTVIHLLILIMLIAITKIIFGMRSDVGGYIVASYVSFMIYATTWQILNRSDYFDSPGSFLFFPSIKYRKSSLSDVNKELILKKIKKEMEAGSYFTNNLASLSGLARQINEFAASCLTGDK